MQTEIRSTIPQLYIKVNGADLPREAFDAVLEGIVEGSLHLPDACTLRIHDHEFKWLDSNHWKEGNAILIQAGQGRDQLITIFEGEVTTLELDLAGMGVATLTVRCMDKAHRLHRGKNRETFNNSKDSDVVSNIAQKNGFTSDIDTTATVHPWIIQNNQSDWEFLQFLAQRNGHRVYLEGGNKLCFKKMSDRADKEVELEWGKDLRSFRIRVNSSNQVSKVTVRSWDPKKKQSIVGQASQPQGTAKVGMRSDGGATSKQAFGNAEMVVVDRPVRSVEEANKMAQSICDEIGNSFIEADGLCYNHPELKPNHKVKLKNIGQRFNGTYIVTSTTHTFSAAEGFSTQFVISGKQPATLMSILGGSSGGGGGSSASASKGSPNAGSIVVGIVTDNKDPENLARVKVKFPALSDNLTTDWIRITTPMAGAGRGFMFLPEVDDEVLVAFENGDVHQGYVIGCLWNGKDKPPMMTDYAVEGGKVRRRRLKTRYGHTLEFDDDGMIILRTKGGQVFEMQDDVGMRMSTATGHQIYLSNPRGVVMRTKSGKFIHGLDGPDGGVQMYDEFGNLVSIDTNSNSVGLAANMTVTIKSGGMINVQGTGPISINGPMVNINSGGGATKPNKKENDDALAKDHGKLKKDLPGVDIA